VTKPSHPLTRRQTDGSDPQPFLGFLAQTLEKSISLIAPLHLPPGLLDSPRTTRRAKDYSNPRLFGPPTASLERIRSEMNKSKNADFAERLSTAADAKKAQLERAARARSAAESPTAVERRRAREEVGVARDARITERKAKRSQNQKKLSKCRARATHSHGGCGVRTTLVPESNRRSPCQPAPELPSGPNPISTHGHGVARQAAGGGCPPRDRRPDRP